MGLSPHVASLADRIRSYIHGTHKEEEDLEGSVRMRRMFWSARMIQMPRNDQGTADLQYAQLWRG